MANLAIALLALAAAIVAVILWLRRAADRSDKAFAAKVRRHGLGRFDSGLRGDVARRLRPMGHLSLTRMMIEVLEQLDDAVPGPGQAAMVDPPDEGYRLACEELVTLNRLVRTSSGAYVRTQGKGPS